MADKATGFVALFAIPLQHRTPLYLICLSAPPPSPPAPAPAPIVRRRLSLSLSLSLSRPFYAQRPLYQPLPYLASSPAPLPQPFGPRSGPRAVLDSEISFSFRSFRRFGILHPPQVIESRLAEIQRRNKVGAARPNEISRTWFARSHVIGARASNALQTAERSEATERRDRLLSGELSAGGARVGKLQTDID
jgi:hypothetical protein